MRPNYAPRPPSLMMRILVIALVILFSSASHQMAALVTSLLS